MAKAMPGKNNESHVHPQNESLFQRARRWASERRIFSKAKKTIAVAAIASGGAGVAHHVANVDIPGPIPVGAAVDQGAQFAVDKISTVLNSTSTQDAENQVANQEQKMAQESQQYVFKNGEFFVDASLVNNMHIVTFGSTNVSPEFKSYRVDLANLVKNPYGSGWTLEVQATDESGKVMIEPLACDPGAEVGGGPAGGAVMGKKGNLVPMGSEEASGISLTDLSHATGSTESVPTSNPPIPTAPNS
jgi:hypothetical protein